MRESVSGLLKGLNGLEPLKRLFWSELNYDRANQLISTLQWTDPELTALADDPLIIAVHGDSKVIYGNEQVVWLYGIKAD